MVAPHIQCPNTSLTLSRSDRYGIFSLASLQLIVVFFGSDYCGVRLQTTLATLHQIGVHRASIPCVDRLQAHRNRLNVGHEWMGKKHKAQCGKPNARPNARPQDPISQSGPRQKPADFAKAH